MFVAELLWSGASAFCGRQLARMARPTPEKIADIILGRRQVYGLDGDSQIRQAANRLSARALFEILERLDDQSPDFHSHLSALTEFPSEEIASLIAFDTVDIGRGKPETDPLPSEKPTEFYLRLVFRNEDAAYYQFPLFPELDTGYVLGAARKRSGAV